MVDDSGKVRAKLDELAAQARADHGKWPALRGYMLEVLHCPNPRPEARAWLEDRLAKFAETNLVEVVRMAYEDPDPENKRAASMVILRNAERMPDPRVRAEHLQALSKNTKLHPDARAEAERLLRVERQLEDVRSAARMCNGIAKRDELTNIAKSTAYYPEARLKAGHLLLEEMKKMTDAYRAGRTMMDDERLLAETRLEAMRMVVDYCKATQRGLGMMGEIVTSGKCKEAAEEAGISDRWKEIVEDAGIWLVDFHIKTKDNGLANRVAEAPGTPDKVKEHAKRRFEEIGYRPTKTGMPAVRVEDLRRFMQPPKGVPPSPKDLRAKITPKGQVG